MHSSALAVGVDTARKHVDVAGIAAVGEGS